MACTHHGWWTGDRKFHFSTAAATFKHGLSFILNAVLYINTVHQECPMFFSELLHANEFMLWVESGAERPLPGSHIDPPDLAESALSEGAKRSGGQHRRRIACKRVNLNAAERPSALIDECTCRRIQGTANEVSEDMDSRRRRWVDVEFPSDGVDFFRGEPKGLLDVKVRQGLKGQQPLLAGGARSRAATAPKCDAQQGQAYQRDRSWFGELAGRGAATRAADNAASELKGVAHCSYIQEFHAIGTGKRNSILEVAGSCQHQRKNIG